MAAGEHYASGDWFVQAGREEEFVRRWEAFLDWTREAYAEDFEDASLIRDTRDPTHFVSFSRWTDEESVERWMKDEAFGHHFGACRALCARYHGGAFSIASARTPRPPGAGGEGEQPRTLH